MTEMKPLAAVVRGKGSEQFAASGGECSDHIAGVPVGERFPDCLVYLSDAPRWCLWTWRTRRDRSGTPKKTKVPLQATGGMIGDSARNNDPKTWTTLEEASSALSTGGADGIGLQLLDLAGFMAFDLDDVRDKETGALLPWAADLVARSGSYVEVTPSGEGLRILGRVSPEFPAAHLRRAHGSGGSFEIYANVKTGRYITVTGDRLADAPDRLADLDHLAIELLGLSRSAPLLEQSTTRGSVSKFNQIPKDLQERIASPASADRSAGFQGIVNSLHRLGVSQTDALAMFEAHPNGPAKKYLDGGRLPTELQRSWSKAGCQSTPLSNEGDTREIHRLAALSNLEYDKVRKSVAKQLGVRVSNLDAEVSKCRATQPQAAGAGEFLRPTPWPDRVDGVALAEEIRCSLLSHVVFQSPSHADAATLWIIGTYLMDEWSLWPKLLVRSPEKRCGKSTALEVIEAHVCAALMTSNITAAALFRSIEKWGPTLIIDEADRFLAANEETNGIINAGHMRRTAFVMRVEEIDRVRDPVRFSVWGAQVIACIGKQLDTLEDRSICINLRRKLTSERVSKVSRRLFEMSEPLRRKVARWTQDNATRIGEHDDEPPSCGNDRAQDNWTPLWRISAALGGPWPDRAATAYVLMERQESDPDNESGGVMLLRDLMDIFDSRNVGRLPSATILGDLLAIEDRPWIEWRNGRALSAVQMAKLLRPFDVRSRKHRFGDGPQQGYQRADVKEAFRRYCAD